jgi:hypothetical protein
MPLTINTQGSSLNNSLEQVLMCEDIVPGAELSYQAAKVIYTHHPLGGKMVDAPIKMAQSQARTITVQGEAPDEVAETFVAEWHKMGIDAHIANAASISRIYGISSTIFGVQGAASIMPVDMAKIWDRKVFFNELDPLNTAGSLVLNQIPTDADFNKPLTVRSNGQTYHRSRFVVLMNERPVYLDYTNSAFGFVGRSVYQRALFPLKSFIRSMQADDVIETKLALLVAKMSQGGSVIDSAMQKLFGVKRNILVEAQNGNVISIGEKESIETLNMQNVDGAGTFARGNIIKNIATAGDMPAFFLENETLAEGFGEGTEDAKNIARYIDGIRAWLEVLYKFYENVVQYRAWSPLFYQRMQEKYPAQFKKRDYMEVFGQWREDFRAEWPSLLKEPESKEVEVDKVRLEATVSVAQTLMPEMDPKNKAILIQWVADCVGSNKLLFQKDLQFDMDALEDFAQENRDNAQESHETEQQTALNPPKAPMAKLGSIAGSKR